MGDGLIGLAVIASVVVWIMARGRRRAAAALRLVPRAVAAGAADEQIAVYVMAAARAKGLPGRERDALLPLVAVDCGIQLADHGMSAWASTIMLCATPPSTHWWVVS